jgi:hypothetical protein
VERGNEGRTLAIEELSLLSVLCHYLTRRLSDSDSDGVQAADRG